MSIESKLPSLEHVEQQIGERLRELRLLRSLRRILKRKQSDDSVAETNRKRRQADRRSPGLRRREAAKGGHDETQ